MCYTLKDKQQQGAGRSSSKSHSPPSSPAGGAGKDSKEEANATIIDSEGRKTTDAYDEVLSRTDTPRYILAIAPVIDTLNWLMNPCLYCLAPACKWEYVCGVCGGLVYGYRVVIDERHGP